jgi:Mitochondrial ribosomal protein L37
MILRHFCTRIRSSSIRTFHTSSKTTAASKPLPSSNVTPPTSTAAPFPPIPRPEGNDPDFVHPPSSVKAGAALRGVQLLKNAPEIVALPDDYYPDWLWEFFEDPQSVQDRLAPKQEIEKKKEIYLAQKKEEDAQKQLIESKKSRFLKPGQKRTLEEKQAVRREAQNEAWLLNREKEYEYPQFEMPPERNRRFHKKIMKDKIKQDNYLRARGMK